MPTVWVLYEEQGEYSNYQMSICGVFDSDELGKAAVAGKWGTKAESWVLRRGVWHLTATREMRWETKNFTLAPYLMNECRDPDERLAAAMAAQAEQVRNHRVLLEAKHK